MKVIVAGGRNLVVNEERVARVVAELKKLKATEVISGHARGGDRIGELAARRLGLPCPLFPANWERDGKAAGIIRNRAMAEYADALIALPGGRGTQNMIDVARFKGLQVVVLP